MSATSGVIVDLDGGDDRPAGSDRRRALVYGFAICLALSAAAVGRDGLEAAAPTRPPGTIIPGRPENAVDVPQTHALTLPPGTSDARLFTMADRLANEPLLNLPFIELQVRGTEGLGILVGAPEGAWVMWTEGGTAYWLSSEHRDLSDLVDLAGSLR